MLKELAAEAEKSFSKSLDFSNESPLSKACSNVLDYLDKYKIGPAVLSLLVMFSFPEESRKQLWQELEKAVQENRNG